MTDYAAVLAAHGKQVDDSLAAITGDAPTTDAAAAGSVLGAQWNTSLATATPSTPKTLWGSSGGGWDVPLMLTKVTPTIVRCFNPGDATAALGKHIVYSNDGGHNRGYDLIGVTSINNSAAKSWLAELQAASPQKAKHLYVIWGHEEDIHSNDPVKLQAVYKGGKVVLNEMRRLGWTYVRSVVCTTGMPYDTTWYKSWNLAAADMIGIDNYARQHWSTIRAWSKTIGKRWGVPENGIKAGSLPASGPFTDAQIKQAMIADHDSAGGEAEFFTYWPNGNQDLVNMPLSTAQLKAYCVA